MMIKTGDIFLFSSGEYSDYSIHTLCKAKQDFDPELLQQEYLAQCKEEDKGDFYRFINFVINIKNIAEELQYKEFYIGSYSELDCKVQEGGQDTFGHDYKKSI